MKKTGMLIFTALMVVFLATGCAAIQPQSSSEPVHSMSVTGTGTVYIQPDIARVNIGVETESTDASEALAENTANANAIRQVLVEKGVADGDIQTSNFSIYQTVDYYDREDSETQKTFIVQNTVSVIVRDLDNLGEVLAAVVDQGANTIYGVSFDIEDSETAYTEARDMAIQDAQSQAEAIAEAAGVRLGEISSLSIYDSGSPARTEMEEADMVAGIGGSPPPISSGTLTIQVSVYITYDFN
jgi:hypothetical protein